MPDLAFRDQPRTAPAPSSIGTAGSTRCWQKRLQRLADQLLMSEGAIDLRGVEEGDAALYAVRISAIASSLLIEVA